MNHIHVSHEIALHGKVLLALVALVGPFTRVHSFVDPQTTRAGKAHLALSALERPLARVYPLMHPQAILNAAVVAAVGALELLHTAVHLLLMPHQMRRLHEAHVALEAAERPLACVDPQVRLQVAFPLRAVAALRTLEHLVHMLGVAFGASAHMGLLFHGHFVRLNTIIICGLKRVLIIFHIGQILH